MFKRERFQTDKILFYRIRFKIESLQRKIFHQEKPLALQYPYPLVLAGGNEAGYK